MTVCGVTAARGPVPRDIARAAAEAAAARGPRSWATVAARGGFWSSAGGEGPLVDLPEGDVVLGLSRLPTTGASGSPQPASGQRPWMAVYNGAVPGCDDVAELAGRLPDLSGFLAWAAPAGRQVVLASDGERLAVGSVDDPIRGHMPLYVAAGDGWVCVASRAFVHAVPVVRPAGVSVIWL